MEEKQKGFWNTLKANWYQKGLKFNTLPETALKIILPETKDCKTFLDVGAGCGTFAIPLSKAGEKVTAIDPSAPMITLLEEEIKKRRIKNIKTIRAAWGETEVKPHDVILCSNVPELLKDSTLDKLEFCFQQNSKGCSDVTSEQIICQGSIDFLKQANALAKKAVFLIEGADPNADKFYYKELYPLIFNKPFTGRTDYFKTYTNLHNLGIFANVEIIKYAFDQPFDNMKEAMDFWKEYMGIVTAEHDEKLCNFLEGKLEKFKGGLIARFHKRSAVIWWKNKQ